MILPAEIGRANAHDVRIRWRDGGESFYPARELRLACPCALCIEETTGRKLLDPATVAEDVHPTAVNLVGRYAVNFTFSDGHASGIYTFEHLRSIRPASSNAGITSQSTMAEVLEKYPGAKSALFRRYHVGGCSDCGYEPTDTLEAVLRKHNVLDVEEVIRHIERSEELNAKIRIAPKELKKLLDGPKPPRLLDVRTPEEWEIGRIEGATLVDHALSQEIMEKWPKDERIVLYCHVGERSLEAASFLVGHGFSNVLSLDGGIDAWSKEIDQGVPRY
ncbi:MAG: DUF971 domain-containing protein [Planctomycetes bacterium]|nr:DUF971 domain-containing protein [Planctomycetota bacterium]